MDPRHPSHPFSRPPSQQPGHDPRFGPITPSPFASQPSAQRSDTLHKNDPFLRRRNDPEEPRGSPSLTNAPQSYTLSQTSRYPSHSISIPQDAAISNTHPRRSSFGVAGLWGDVGVDRLALHAGEGMETFLSTYGGCVASHTAERTRFSIVFGHGMCGSDAPTHARPLYRRAALVGATTEFSIKCSFYLRILVFLCFLQTFSFFIAVNALREIPSE